MGISNYTGRVRSDFIKKMFPDAMKAITSIMSRFHVQKSAKIKIIRPVRVKNRPTFIAIQVT